MLRFSSVLLLSVAFLAAQPARAATTYTVTISSSGYGPQSQAVNVGDTVTWSNYDYNAAHTATSDTAGLWDSGSLGFQKSFSHVFNTIGSFGYHSTSSGDTMTGTIVVSAGAGTFTQLQVLVPGETAAPGTASGKAGTPTAQTAGTAFDVTVNAVDTNWNLVNTVTDTVAITSSDTGATLPANKALAAGTGTFSVTLKATATVTATDATDNTKTANTSSSITVNAASTVGPFTKLQVLVPGETAAPGTTTGKTGQPTAQTAGTAFNVTVNAVDANWNLVNTVTDTVAITSSDSTATLPANAALAAGTGTFSVTLKATATVTATDAATSTITPNTSPSITVNAGGPFTKLQILVPGETAAPGTQTGKTGTPTTQTAGTAFNVTVNAVDANWNKVATVTDTVAITASDTTATLPPNAALASGTGTFSVTLKATATVTVTDATTGTIAPSTSPSITVNAAGTAGPFTKLQVLLPGETAAQGTTTGKTGTPTAQTAGTAFNVTVNAVDANWVVVNTVTDTVAITSSDNTATLPPNAALASGTGTFSVTLKTTATVTASDVTTPTMTANTSSSVTVGGGGAPGVFTKLQVLVPGESAAPGTTTGKTGAPTPQTAGTAFNVTVNAVDANWNVVASVGDTVEFTSNDTRAVFPATAVLVQGTASISVTFNSAFSDTITAGDVDTPGIASVASSPVLMGQGTFNINPHGDSVNGGGTITIFANGVSGGAALTVLFGSQSVQGTAASDGASLTCTVPPLSGATVSQKVDLTVSNNGSGTATLAGGFYYSADTFLDTDWDSYPDALENVEGSDPNNWASFPVGSDSQALTPAGPKDLVVKSLKIQLNFAKNNGSVALAGTLAVPKGLDLSKQVPALFVAGNIAEKFKMDAKGKGTPATGTGKDSFTLSAKLDSKKLTVGGATKFSVKLTLAKLSQDDLTALGNQGLANATVTTKNVPLTLIVLFSNTDFRFSAGTAYKATRNKTGTATYPHH